MKRPSLTAPFKNVETLDKGGRKLTYVPASEVVDRLNTVLGVGNWSYQVEAWRDATDPDWVIAKGHLRVHARDLECVIEQYGGQQVNRKKDGSLIDLGDDMKGASSDALKKAAQHLGVGLYLSLGHPPMSAAQFDSQGKGADRSAEDDGDQHSIGTVSGQGEGDTPRSPSPALTPGYSGEEF